MEQSQWIGALIVESFLSQQACRMNQTFLLKTFEYLGLSSELLEKNINNAPEKPLECLYPIIIFKNPTSVEIEESEYSQPSLPPPPVVYDDTEVKLEKFIALKMAKVLLLLII